MKQHNVLNSIYSVFNSCNVNQKHFNMFIRNRSHCTQIFCLALKYADHSTVAIRAVLRPNDPLARSPNLLQHSGYGNVMHLTLVHCFQLSQNGYLQIN
jgi:hypothetical protein